MSRLDPAPEELRSWLDSAANFAVEYLASIRGRRVYPATSSSELRDKLRAALPQTGAPFQDVLATFIDNIVPNSRQNAHPRMFGYVQSPGVAVAAIADLLASILNANLTAWRSSPAPVEIERLAIDWISELIGVGTAGAGLFVSGGSMANFAALAAARRAKIQDGERRALRIYASTETHHSVAKAAALLGVGQVRHVEADDALRIRCDDLVRQIECDRRDGHLPFCVVANAGTVNTGVCDPLAEIAEIAQRHDVWMHVDASYGGFASLASSARPLFEGLSQADSIALDPHKWLYLPVDCGCVLYRDPASARAAFAHDAEYTRILGHEADEAFAFWDYGPELSRRFRALKVWMLLNVVGVEELRASIENDLACARHLEQLVRESDDFEMLAPVTLSIFCFRHLPSHLAREDDGQLDAWNERLLVALQRDGSSYLSNTRVRGRFALRGCVMNYRTTKSDMEILLADLRRVAAATST